MVRRALEVATARAWTSADVSAGTPPPSLRRADAFVAVAERYLAGATAGPVVSEYGFRVESDGEGGFRFFRADGMKVEVSCAPPVLGMNPVDALRGRHHAAGIAIDAQAGFPHWDGRPPDYDQIVFCLTARQGGPPSRAVVNLWRLLSADTCVDLSRWLSITRLLALLLLRLGDEELHHPVGRVVHSIDYERIANQSRRYGRQDARSAALDCFITPFDPKLRVSAPGMLMSGHTDRCSVSPEPLDAHG